MFTQSFNGLNSTGLNRTAAELALTLAPPTNALPAMML